ncbi:hypothetical protein [Aquiluna sp. Uisw_065]|uniref:hypothetical protein n=1 Tax=Aquiluna sp. Uisw_065 TaxID=3230967 RepID=UPI0039EA4CF5
MTNNDNSPESSGQQPKPMPLWLDFLWFAAKFLIISVVLIGALIISVYVITILVAILLIIRFIYKPTIGSKRWY